MGGIQAGHWTSNGNVVDLIDTRVSPNNVDAGTIWIVWNAGATKVWSYNKVDSVVGDRCYFAQPQCTVQGTSGNLSGSGSNKISKSLWGSDAALPPAILSLFEAGTLVNVAATDIRPEDAQFAICRANSSGPVTGGSGVGSIAGATPPSDGLDGLGYNSNIPAGVCPATFGTSGGLATQNDYVGEPILTGSGTGSQANVLSFNISGSDPITATTVPAFTVVKVGAVPIVFVDQRETQLKSVTNATDVQLQQVFSGTNCNGNAFTGGVAGAITAFLREPTSGTMNTTEATVFRKPDVYGGNISGVSQETGVTSNTLAGPCAGGGGSRYRGIGTSEVVNDVKASSTFGAGGDGIAYTFFSYGNVGALANSANWGYIQLEGYDPIFAAYAGGDPGQPATAGNPSPGTPGTLPAAANLPASCAGVFPCSEKAIWTGGLSFPNLRDGFYYAWSIVRLVATPLTTAEKSAAALAKASNLFAVEDVPDYAPVVKVLSGGVTVDPGITYLRSHYQQYDGAGNLLGAAPVNTGTGEKGGDMGGCIEKTSGSTSKIINHVDGDYTTCNARPVPPS